MMLKEFFYFQKSDRRILLFFIVLAVIALTLIWALGGQDVTNDVAETLPGDSLRAVPESGKTPNGTRQTYVYDTGERHVERFPFDPNTADSTTLLRLGLQPWQVKNIYRYRAKGGIYRKPSDFARLYGLTAKEYRELEPYIRISDDYRPAAEVITDRRTEPYVRDTIRYPQKLKEGELVALNSADTTLLKRVPGIGSYYARRIVWYRDKLGGYYSTAQLLEIDGFPESALPYFSIGEASIRKININKLSQAQLRQHPYISYLQARDIAEYRRQRGNISDINQLRLLKDFTQRDFERLRHYVEY